MKINPVNYISFRSTSRCTMVQDGNPSCESSYINRNTTDFYRRDINWDYLCKYLNNKYMNAPKVNTYCYACSDGSEPYSFVMKMISDLGDSANKYFPVIAKDNDDYVINQAKSHRITLYSYDEESIVKHGSNLNDYFVYIDEEQEPYCPKYHYYVEDKLYDKVEFQNADITKDIASIRPDNSIVFCRNFWPYLKSEEKINQLAKDLYNQLGDNSCVILGEYDFCYPNPENKVYMAMINAGFNLKDETLRIFEKPKQENSVVTRSVRFPFVWI